MKRKNKKYQKRGTNSLNKLRHKKIFQLVDSALVKNFPANEDVLKFHESIENRYPP